MKAVTPMQYMLSRLKLAVTSPKKLWLFIRILLRYPILLIYYKIYGIRHGEVTHLNHARNGLRRPDHNPLISIVIATYNRAELLRDRPLASILEQTYQNFEVIVVGDGCTDNTAEIIADLKDARIRYINLQARGTYPSNPKHRWLVAGVPPMNHASEHTRGDWIAHIDDDEIFTHDHLEKLLRFAQGGNYEFVYSKARHERQPGDWVEVGKTPLVKYFYMNHCGHSTTLWRQYINVFNYDINTWRWNVPADLNRWSRIQLGGVRIGFLPEVTAIAPLRPGTTTYGHEAQDRV